MENVRMDAVNLRELTAMVAEKTNYSKKDTYEVLRTAFDTIGDLLVDGHKVSIHNLFSVYLETGLMTTTLPNVEGECICVRTHFKIAQGIKDRAKLDK